MMGRKHPAEGVLCNAQNGIAHHLLLTADRHGYGDAEFVAAVDTGIVTESIRVIKAIDPDIIVEQAAGITSGRQVYDLIRAGAEAAGAASGICKAPDPCAMAAEMIHAVRAALNDMET